MNVPSGYTALDMVGFTDKGAYNSATSYVKNDLVRYNGDTWRCKLDDTVNHTPEEGTYWTIFIDAPSALDDLTDVTISSVANEDILEYDSATSKWKNSTGLSNVKQALSNYVADYGVKNLLENTSSSFDANGVHFVVNSDGTVTVSTESGGATINTPLNIATGITINKPVRLSGCPSGGSLNSYWLDTGVTTYADIGSGVSVNSLSNATIRLVVKGGTVITTPIVFKPMITDANAPNSDYNHYVPYAMTNKELTDNKAEKSDLASISITGTTNSTGSTIASGTYFYLNGQLVKAKANIANGATFTANTNYEVVTAGALNDLRKVTTGTLSLTSDYFDTTDSYNNGSWRRCGNVVTFIMNGITKAIIPNGNIYFAGGLPVTSDAIQVGFAYDVTNGTGAPSLLGQVRVSSGYINYPFNNQIEVGTRIRIVGTYICD